MTQNTKGHVPAVPFAIQFRGDIDECLSVETPRITRMTSEGGRVTGYED